MNESICRVCLCRDEHLTSLFHRIDGVSLGDKIMSCTSIHIGADDRLPTQICVKCVDRLNDSYDFKILCEYSDLTLRKRIDEIKTLDSNNTVSIKIEQSCEINADLFPVKCEIKCDSDENDVNDIKYKIEENNVELKIENDKTHKRKKLKRINKIISKSRFTKTRSKININENFENDIARSDSGNDDSDISNGRLSDDSDSDNVPLKLNFKSILKHSIDKRFRNDNGKKRKRSIKTIDSEEIFDDIRKKTKPSWKPKKEQCPTCGKVMSSKYTLEMHLRIHTGEKPFKCSHCNKTFSLASSLRVHQRVHTGEKPLLCVTCGKGFSQHAGLISHMRLHTGEKPFKCSLCPSTFRTQGHLQYHTKLHLGERNFKCSVCSKAFITKGDLDSHFISHTGERPFICSVCGMRMTRSSHLKLHMKTHTGEKPYKCEICGSCFIQRGYWMRHVNKHKITDDLKHDSKEDRLENKIQLNNIDKGELTQTLKLPDR